MKGIILHTSKYRATKCYSEWLAEETGFDCTETQKARIEDIKRYDTIILGGGIYASGIAGLSFLRKNIVQLQGKNVIVFCVGASPYDEAAFQQIIAYNLKGPLTGLSCFYCRGRWDMDRMSFVHRNLCRLLQKATAKKKSEECAVWEKALIEAGEKKCDWMDKSYITPILQAL